MIGCAKIIIETDGGGGCSPKCSGYKKQEDGTVECYWFRQPIVDDKRCELCMKPEVYEEHLIEWAKEMNESQVTKKGARRLCDVLEKAMITKAEYLSWSDTFYFDVKTGGGSEYHLGISNDVVRLIDGRKDVVAYYFTPWI